MFGYKIALIALLFAVSSKAASQTPLCKVSDSTNAVVVSGIRSMMTSSDPVRIKLTLPLVSTSAVNLVTGNDSLCNSVRMAMDSVILGSNPNAFNLGQRPIHVVQIGTYFAALNPGSSVSGMLPVMFFDNLIRFVGVVPF